MWWFFLCDWGSISGQWLWRSSPTRGAVAARRSRHRIADGDARAVVQGPQRRPHQCLAAGMRATSASGRAARRLPVEARGGRPMSRCWTGASASQNPAPWRRIPAGSFSAKSWAWGSWQSWRGLRGPCRGPAWRGWLAALAAGAQEGPRTDSSFWARGEAEPGSLPS